MNQRALSFSGCSGIACLAMTLCLCACDSPDSTSSQPTKQTQSGTSSESHHQERPTQTDKPKNGEQTADGNHLLKPIEVMEQAGWQRTEDMASTKLPPTPQDTQVISGVYEHDNHRVGVIVARYPRRGFALPHIHHVQSEAQKENSYRAVLDQNTLVVEFRATSEEALEAAKRLIETSGAWNSN